MRTSWRYLVPLALLGAGLALLALRGEAPSETAGRGAPPALARGEGPAAPAPPALRGRGNDVSPATRPGEPEREDGGEGPDATAGKGDADTISGWASYPSGITAYGVDVRADPVGRSGDARASPAARAVTGSFGAFALRGLAPGTYRVSVDRAPSCGGVEARAGDAEVHLLVAAARVHVRVVGPTGDALLRGGAWRRVTRGSRISTGGAPLTEGHSDFDVEVEVGARLAVGAKGPDGTVEERDLGVIEDERPRDVVLRPHAREGPPGGVRLVVSGPRGEVLRSPRVRVLSPHVGIERTELHPDGDGVISPIPPGRWRLRAPVHASGEEPEAAYWFPIDSEVDVRSGTVVDCAIVARPAARISLVVRAQGAARGEGSVPFVHGTRVGHPEDETVWWPAWDEPDAGLLLEPGTWHLEAEAEGFEGKSLDVEARAGETTPVEIVLTAP